jgi:hypothetical protein
VLGADDGIVSTASLIVATLPQRPRRSVINVTA